MSHAVKNFALLICLISLLLKTTDGAAELRCPGGKLVRLGDDRYQVLAKCGMPADGGVKRKSRGQEVVIYDFGPNRFVKYLTFHNGKLASVTTGGYGILNPSTTRNQPYPAGLGKKCKRCSKKYSSVERTSLTSTGAC